MDKSFWIDRWDTNVIGFHRDFISEHLTSLWRQFTKGGMGKVFVPMCGKSLDLKFFSELGHKVIGVEFSELAVKQFFEENKFAYSVEANQRFIIYKGDSITLYCGDFFNLNQEDLKGVEFVYDRASLIALPEDIREKYVELFNNLLSDSSIFLETISFSEPNPLKPLGPPFSISDEWLDRNYKFKRDLIKVLDQKRDIHGGSTSEFKSQISFLN